MLLTVDIGNTSVALGAFKDKELVHTWRLGTSISRMPDEYAAIILGLLNYDGLKPEDITDVCMCSVVPPLVVTFEDVFERYFNKKPMVVGAGTKTGVKIRMDNPREVGADRIVHAVAAHHLYGGPVIIVDMGTATTFDTMTKDGEYIGGAIAPGIRTAAEALFTRTAMLPRVKLARPAKVIGTNTISAMQSGIVFGYVSLIEGMVTRMQKEFGGKTKVVATGGYSDIIAGETSVIDVVNPDLVLIGLRLVYAMNKS